MILIPILDESVPPGGGQLAGLVRMPEDANAGAVVGLPLGQHAGRLPIPDATTTVAIATCKKTEKIEKFKKLISQDFF